MKSIIFRLIIASCLLMYNGIQLHAQVTLDGTTGSAGELSLTGPTYDIKSEYGEQAGTNLFHSFEQFSISKGKVANFGVSPETQNIISRVTGGSHSWIDGTLRSTISGTSDISGANLYLLNPAGVMFGPHASLDMGGSFHVSTADYLHMGENEVFYTDPLENGILSAARPTAFGFLDNNIAPISVQGRGEISEQEWKEIAKQEWKEEEWKEIAELEWRDNPTGLHVREGETISLIGGDIKITDGTFYRREKLDKEGNQVYEIQFDEYGMPVRDGNDNPIIVRDEDGNPVPEIEIKRVGLNAPEGRINIASLVSEGEVGTDMSSISARQLGNIEISENSLIDVGGERAGNIFIRGGKFFAENSFIHAITTGEKDGGEINIHTNGNMSFINGAGINGSTEGKGNGSSVVLNASGSVVFSGENQEEGRTCAISIKTLSEDEDAGNSGSLRINGENISFENGSIISTNTMGKGDAGNVTLIAGQSVNFTGRGSDNANNRFGGLFAIVRAESTGGNSGNVFIETGDLLVTDGNHIFTSAYGPGESGNITVRAAGKIIVDGVHSSGSSYGWGSTINASSNPNFEDMTSGDSGKITLEADELILKNGGYIASSSIAPVGTEGGRGGEINIKARSISLSGVNPHGENADGFGSGIYARSKGVKDNVGSGGKITIESESLTIENGAVISSSTFSNSMGGDIIIKVNDSVYIGGDSSGIKLKEPGYSQLKYQERFGEDVQNYSVSGIYARSDSALENAGSSGKISLSSENLILGQGEISTSTKGGGNANDINLEVSRLNLEEDSSISSASSSETQGGNAGRIIIGKEIIKNDAGEIAELKPAVSVRIHDGSSVSTEAGNAGGGKIFIHASEELCLQNGKITSSVSQGQGMGGDVTVGFNPSEGRTEGPDFVILNRSDITANADKGDGGAVFIYTDNYTKSSDSNVTATSWRGNDGIVKIEAPDFDISSGLTVLPSDYLDAARWMKIPCKERSGEKVSQFALTARDGIPTSPDDWLASPPLAFDTDVVKQAGAIGNRVIMGEDFYHKGDFEQAVKIWEQALSFLDPEGIAYLSTLSYLTNAYQAVGHYKKADSVLRKILPVVEENGNKYFTALFYSSFGDLNITLGNFTDAEKYLKIASSSKTENSLARAVVLNNMGNLYAVKEEYNSAIENYKRCLEFLEIIGPLPDALHLKSKTLINLARACAEKGLDEDIVVSSLNNAISHIEPMADSLPGSSGTVFDLISLSLLVRKTGVKTGSSGFRFPAFQLLDKARDIAENLQDSSMISQCYGYLGQLYEDEERYSESLGLTRNAMFPGQNYPELQYLWHWQAGRLFRAEGNIENALDAYKKAADILSPAESEKCERNNRDKGSKDWENDIPPLGIIHEFYNGYRRKYVFEKKVKAVFLELTDLMLEQADGLDGRERENKLYEARDVMERLKTAEIQDFFEDECLTVQKKSIKTDPHTAILYPVSFPGSLKLLLELHDSMKLEKVEVSSEAVKDATKLFRDSLDKSSGNYSPERCAYFARMFYKWLISGFEEELAQRDIDTLVVAPDGPLRMVPFSSFHDGRQFLVEKYAVVTIPATTLTVAESFGEKEGEILACGLSAARDGFPPLPNVQKELEDIKNIMDARTLQDEEFIVDNLSREFKNENSVIHLATHGVFGSSAKESFLLTYDGRLTMSGLEKLIRLGRYHEKPLELITLSACQTAVGDDRAALGLAGVAIKAGASSAVATLWFVDDESTYLIISEFYRQLKLKNISKARALQNAQKKIIEDYPAYKHPAYWAPFLLIGNWL